MGDKLIVALLLKNRTYLHAVNYSEHQAKQRLSGDLMAADVNEWLAIIRAAL